MTMESPFVKASTDYSRDLNIAAAARSDAAHYLSKQEGIPYEDALAYVSQVTGQGGELEIVDKPTRLLNRTKTNDREKIVIPFSMYLQEIQEREWLLAPTMTNYENPNEKRSILSEYIDENIQKRKVVKKAGQKDKANKNFLAAAIKHVLQSTFKIKNNSLSGAHSNPHNALYLKSAHPTLTSTCRSATSYSNANTERYLMGNRHYRDADITINNIVSIVQMTDYDKVQSAMDAFNLHYPSSAEVFEAVKMSCDMYWDNPERLEDIRQYILALTPIERAAYLYTQDLHHLTKYNSDVVRSFITPLAVKATTPIDVDEARTLIDSMDADVKALIGIVCAAELKGTTWWDCEKNHPERFCLIGAQVKQTMQTIEDFSLLINSFWCTDNPPPSMAYFPDSIRKSVIVSDTDSTIFTTQDWVRWYNDGALKFDDVSNAVGAVLVYLTSQTTVHLLAQLSAGMGVIPEHLNKLEMKNEFFFPVLSLTSKAKHYYSYQSACEGNVYDELEPEYKGVSLKNSKIPKHIMDRFHNFTESVMDTVMAEEKISLLEKIEEAKAIEDEIVADVKAGGTTYLQLSQVKDPDSYKNPQSSPYVHYEMWQEVFAPKYGAAPPPSYLGVKLSLELPNPTAVKLWLARIEDRALAERMEAWLTKMGKKDYKVAILPLDVVGSAGIPKELIQAMDIRKLCATLLEPFILVLESLGCYMKNGYNSKLPSDIINESAYQLLV